MLNAKSPRTLNGLYAATDDREQIEKWWAMWPDSLVGIPAGANGLVVLDGDRKSGRDFDDALFEHGLEVPETVTYDTPNNGQHWLYRAPVGVPLNGQANYRGLPGLDRRGGSSYAVWWGPVPMPSEWELAEAPGWLCDPVAEASGSAGYGGDVEEWLDEHRGNPSALLRHIMGEDFVEPGEGAFLHDETLKLIIRIVSLGAQGEQGATEALNQLAERYLADGYEEYESEWDAMVSWAVKHCGGVDVGQMPTFLDVQAKLGEDFPLSLFDGSRPIADLIRAALELDLTPAEVFVLCKAHPEGTATGEAGLWAEIEAEREHAPEPAAPAAPAVVEAPGEKKAQKIDMRILTAEERAAAKKYQDQSFIGDYERFVRAINTKTHNHTFFLSAAWQVMANLVGEVAQIEVDGRTQFCNLFTISLGPTTSGKSWNQHIAIDVLEKTYPGASPDASDDISGGGLLDYIRGRNNKAALVPADETEDFLRAISDSTGRGWQADLMSKITKLYDGRVPKKIRANMPVEETEILRTCFNLYLTGTEAKALEVLNRTMFESGFLPRVLWFVGDRDDLPDEQRGVMLKREKRRTDAWLALGDWRARVAKIHESWGFRTMHTKDRTIWPVDDATMEWWHRKTIVLDKMFDDSPDAEILRAVSIRLSIAATKMAALVAVMDERTSIEKRDFLVALLTIEESLVSMMRVFHKVSASEHSKKLEILEAWLAKQLGGSAPTNEIYRFASERNGWSKGETDSYLNELEAQKRAKRQRLSEHAYEWRVR